MFTACSVSLYVEMKKRKVFSLAGLRRSVPRCVQQRMEKDSREDDELAHPWWEGKEKKYIHRAFRREVFFHSRTRN